MEFQFKIILGGEGAVGKTSLLHRFIHNEFSTSYKMTMGVDLKTKEVKYEDHSVNLTIWDIGGQERFKFMRRSYYSGASGALLIFDLTRDYTYQQLVGKWFPEMLKFIKVKIPFLLIGNKRDLIKDTGRIIEPVEINKFVQDNNSIYMETSARTGENVEVSFIELTKKMIASKSS